MPTDPATIILIAELNAQINALIMAIASGVTRVSYDGRSTEYRDLNEMKKALNFAQTTLARLQNPLFRRPTAGVARYVRPFGNHWSRL